VPHAFPGTGPVLSPATQGPRPAVRRLDAKDGLTPAQAKVLAIVAADPGCSIRSVAARLRVSHATASYHLFALAKLGLLVQARDGREVRHFPGNAAAHPMSYLQALARDPRKAKVIRLLAHGPVHRMTIHEMTQAAGLTFAFLKRTLLQLQGADVVTLERRRYRYTIRLNPERRADLEAACGGECGPEPDASFSEETG